MKMRICILLVLVLCYSFGVAQRVHVVQDKEGIYGIAKTYHIKHDSIVKWNQLVLKTNSKGNKEYVHSNGQSVKKGDSLFVENPYVFVQSSNNNEKVAASFDLDINLDEKKDLFEHTGSVEDSVSLLLSSTSADDNSHEVIIRDEVKQKERKHYYWCLWFIVGVAFGVLSREKCVKKLLSREIETKQSLDVNNENTSETDGLKKQIKKLKNENRKLKKDREGLEIANNELLEENIRLEKQLNESFLGDTEAKKQSNNMIQTNNNAILYAGFIIDGNFSCVTESPNDDTNFELHLENKNTASFVVFKPAIPRIVRNPTAFLQGCEKQVIGQIGEIEIKREGVAECDANGQWKVLNNNKLNVIIR